MKTKAEIRAYMQKYYLEHKEKRHLEYIAWCKGNPKRNRAERGKEKKTPEERGKYGRDYYAAHKDRYAELHHLWCANNSKRYADGQQAWRRRNPHHSRDYKRERVAVVDPLAFQFLDNRVDSNIDAFVIYLHSQNVSEQHIKWFRKDIQGYMGDTD